MSNNASALFLVYERLFAHYGPQHWWPAQTPFEVMVGAVLTQNTAWSRVERAIAALRQHGSLSAEALLALEPQTLGELIRPAGYYTIKTRRLQALCQWYLAQGGFAALQGWETPRLRTELLAIHGVGPETADDILLYAFERPVFVIDAYTRRIGSRLGLLEAKAPYETLRQQFEQALGLDTVLFKEYHALIVAHAKAFCRVRPRCQGCMLVQYCAVLCHCGERPLGEAGAAID
ncbi:endonuclease III domain-containing protein [Thiorhodospira sibirica]|uniref:endonuclease III domain-containing protein n=1 Tax=Thiorhodospira sibirica TaxID=154347 RepID=UPI00022C4698|nr:endonuclease III domain-containing protein [Thiorhodospira sibirica]